MSSSPGEFQKAAAHAAGGQIRSTGVCPIAFKAGYRLNTSRYAVDGSLNVNRTHLKNKDHARGQGAGRRKNVAYKIVCEAFESVCNAVIRVLDYF